MNMSKSARFALLGARLTHYRGRVDVKEVFGKAPFMTITFMQGSENQEIR